MGQSRERRYAEGEVLLIRKPAGWTSFDVVHRIRRITGVRRVGHAGTLDPLATGLLIVCTGKKTKEISSFMGLEKEYEAEMTLGGRTASFDAATPVTETRDTGAITAEGIRATMAVFTGRRMQLPPMYSAVSVGGKRLYRYARAGVEVERQPREVVIHALEPLAITVPVVRFRVTCSKGTYVRSLVDDMGQYLGCGAYVTALERTRIGPYRLADAESLEELAAATAEQGSA